MISNQKMIDADVHQKKRPSSGGGNSVQRERQLNQERQVNLKTCADVYEHWRSYKRLYKKAPRDGAEFQIDYIDTGLAMSEEERARAPIALALHGAPGSYHDFELLINHLASQQGRVIAPNFPEYIATLKTKVLFRHSAEEKAAYLRDFLKSIGVTTIDLLISHSSAIFPTLLILLNANNQAIERRKQAERAQGIVDQQQQLQQQKQKHKKSSKSKVQLNSFSPKTGDQLKGNAEEDGEVFLDSFEDIACDQIDSNNNNNEQIKSSADEVNRSPAVNEGPVIELRQMSLEGRGADELLHKQQQQHEVEVPSSQVQEDSSQTLKRTDAEQRRRNKRRGQDVIVHFDEPIEIKAVALFNPAGHRLPKSMKPTWFKCGSVHVHQHKFGRSLFRKFGPAFLTGVGVPVRVDNMDNVMLSATVMRNSKCQRVVKQLEQLSQMKIPTLLVFSENDKLIEREIFYEITQFMRLDPKKFDVFNNDGDIELSQSIMADWIRVMVFKAGGHYGYSNYAKTVNRAVSELLARVRPDTNTTNTTNTINTTTTMTTTTTT